MKRRQTDDEPMTILLDFNTAVGGLLKVKKPKKQSTAGELRKKIARKQELAEKHRGTADAIIGDDKVAQDSRKYYLKMSEKFVREKTELDAKLKQLTVEAD